MKKIFGTFIILLFTMIAFSQESEIPSVDLKTLDGKTFNTKEISNDGKPIVISFWATWCKPCVKELTAIAELYDDWKEETGVKIIAVSIDDTRSMSRVAPFVNGKSWEYEVLLDPNSDLKKAMNIINVPHTVLIDGDGKIVWKHTGYAEGDEEELFEKIEKLAKGESIN